MLTTFFREEHEIFRKTLRDFVAKELAPHVDEWEKAELFPREVFKKARRAGLPRRPVPRGRGRLRRRLVVRGGVGRGAGALQLRRREHGARGADRRWRRRSSTRSARASRRTSSSCPALHGDKIAALGVSEPNCGSDVASIRTTARKVGGDYVINGAKCWITNGTRADFITLAVRTGDEGYGGISLVLFPTDVKGFKVTRKIDKAGNHASDTAELSFEDCRIPRALPPRRGERGLLLHHDQLPGRAAHRGGQGRRRRAVGARQHHPLLHRAHRLRPADPQVPGVAPPVRRAAPPRSKPRAGSPIAPSICSTASRTRSRRSPWPSSSPASCSTRSSTAACKRTAASATPTSSPSRAVARRAPHHHRRRHLRDHEGDPLEASRLGLSRVGVISLQTLCAFSWRFYQPPSWLMRHRRPRRSRKRTRTRPRPTSSPAPPTTSSPTTRRGPRVHRGAPPRQAPRSPLQHQRLLRAARPLGRRHRARCSNT